MLVLVALVPGAIDAAPQEPTDWDALGEEALVLLQDYLRLPTVNPPGDEALATELLAAVFTAEGIEHEVFESVAGRSNIVARLRGDGGRGGHVVLLNHTDVVPADAAYWSADPFGGEVRNGKLYGRGAADMKGDAIAQLMAMLALHRERVPLSRDVMFMATAGEESGGRDGAGYVVRRRPDLLEGVEYVLTEGGGARRFGSRTVHFVETTQKTPLWLRLRATGVSGHGSTAIQDSAANRLVRALDRIRTFRPQLRLIPAVAAAIRAGAAIVPDPDQAAAMRDVQNSINDPLFLELIQQQYGVLLRNTVSITVIRGSSKTNVISPDAVAELDCRLLPGESPDLFIATLRDVIDDAGIQIETLLRAEPSESPTDSALWRAIERAAVEHDPGAMVLPYVNAGFTDSRYFRDRGIVAYGWSPIVMQPGDGPAHGVDERISVDNFRAAPRLLFDVLSVLAGPSLADTY